VKKRDIMISGANSSLLLFKMMPLFKLVFLHLQPRLFLTVKMNKFAA